MDIKIINLLILGLATWRLASLIGYEEGVGNIFALIRRKLGERYDETSNPIPTNIIIEQITCIWCSSIWIGIFLGYFWVKYPEMTITICLPFALSSFAAIINGRGIRYRKMTW